MFADTTHDEFAAALDGVALELLSEAQVDGPPVDALAVAAAQRLVVAWDDRQAGRGRVVTARNFGGDSVGAILLRPEPRIERRQWAIAHEIGEQVAHRVFERLGVEPAHGPADARETIANQLASRLLLPSGWFLGDATRCNWDLLQLKERYCTASHELIARRMLDFSLPAIITIFDHGSMTLRRSNVSHHVPTPSAAEVKCQQAAHVSGRPQESCGPFRIQAWPIHEPQWKREIVRASWEEFTDE